MSKTFNKRVRTLANEVLALNPGSEEGAFEEAVGKVLDKNNFQRFPNRTYVFREVAKHCRLRLQAKMDKQKRIREFNEIQPSLFA